MSNAPLEYDLGKGLWKAAKGALIAGGVVSLTLLGNTDTFSNALPPGTPEGLAIAAAALIRFLTNYLKVKGVFGG